MSIVDLLFFFYLLLQDFCSKSKKKYLPHKWCLFKNKIINKTILSMLGTQVFMTYLCTLWWISKADNFKFRVIFPMVWVKQWILFLFAVGFSLYCYAKKGKPRYDFEDDFFFFFIIRWFMVCFIALKIFKTKNKNSIKIHWTSFLFVTFYFLFIIMESIVIIAC